MKKPLGFSLLELLIALLLIVAVTLFTTIFWTGLANQYRLRAGLQMLLSQLSEMRTQAVVQNLPLSLSTDTASNRFGVAERGQEIQSWQYLPEGVHFLKAPARSLTFYTRGNAAPAGTFRLGNSAGSIDIVVSLNGRLRWTTGE